MGALLKKYNIAVLDSSIYCARFSDSLMEDLKKLKVYASESYATEVMQLKKILPPEQLDILGENNNFINMNINLKTVDKNIMHNQPNMYYFDTLGLLKLLNDYNGNKCVLITSNQLLIEQVVLSGLDIDIYDFGNDKTYLAKDYINLKRNFEFGMKTSVKLGISTKEVKQGSVIYTDSDEYYLVEDSFKSGLEGSIYKVNNNTEVVKVINTDLLTREKINNVRNLIELREKGLFDRIKWVELPRKLVFSDKERRTPIGFSERFVDTLKGLDEKSLFSGDISDLSSEDSKLRITDGLDICIKIVRQILYLKIAGIYVSDFNFQNFSFATDDRYLMMWDSDSFTSIHSSTFNPTVASLAFNRKFDLSRKLEAINFCEDQLYQFVFRILSLGDCPIFEGTNHYKYASTDTVSQFRKVFIPRNVFELFNETFKDKRAPSAEVLLFELVAAKKALINRPANKTYGEIVKEVIPMLSDDNYEDVLKRCGEQTALTEDDDDELVEKDIDAEVATVEEMYKFRKFIIGLVSAVVVLSALAIYYDQIAALITG